MSREHIAYWLQDIANKEVNPYIPFAAAPLIAIAAIPAAEAINQQGILQGLYNTSIIFNNHIDQLGQRLNYDQLSYVLDMWKPLLAAQQAAADKAQIFKLAAYFLVTTGTTIAIATRRAKIKTSTHLLPWLANRLNP